MVKVAALRDVTVVPSPPFDLGGVFKRDESIV
jgi:hypothetical protein